MSKTESRPQIARDVVARVLLQDGIIGWGDIRAKQAADCILAALAAGVSSRSRGLIDATIALLWSHPEQREILLGQARAEDFEPWPEMDALMAELDVAAPGWRERDHG